MSELIVADGVAYQRVWPRYAGEYEPAPKTPRIVSYRPPSANGKPTPCDRVLACLADGNSHPTSVIRNVVRMNNNTLADALRALVDSGEIELEEVRLPGRPKTKFYRRVEA